MAYVVACKMMPTKLVSDYNSMTNLQESSHVGLRQHGVVFQLGFAWILISEPGLETCRDSNLVEKREDETPEYVRRGGVLPAMMTSLAFPDRRVFRVLLYPKVTT